MAFLTGFHTLTRPQGLLRRPGFVRWGVRIDTAPEWIWLALLAAALWPTWLWMGQRMLDRSDNPLGLLALTALGLLAWQQRRRLRPAPRLPWLALALAGAVAATLCQGWLPSLVVALLALTALAAGLCAFLPISVASASVLGLSVLSLPLLASLQFYAGYPLRVITAEASRWLLMFGHGSNAAVPACWWTASWSSWMHPVRVCRWPGSATSAPAPSRCTWHAATALF
jgi:hypothetical protein